MAHQKFMFDRSFDVEAPAEKAAEVTEVVEEEPEVVVPTFSEEQVEAARKEGFEQGKTEALKEASTTIENQIVNSTKAIGAQLKQLISSQSLVNSDIFRDAIKISRAITQKSFPSINAEHGIQEIELLIRQILSQILEEPRVKIQVHPTLTEHFSERLNEISAETHFEGRVLIIADEAIEQGDCRIDWSNGGAERNLDNVMLEIDAIINTNLAALEGGFEPDPDALEDDTIEPLQSDVDETSESSPESSTQPVENQENPIETEAESTESAEPQLKPHASTEAEPTPPTPPDTTPEIAQETATDPLSETNENIDNGASKPEQIQDTQTDLGDDLKTNPSESV